MGGNEDGALRLDRGVRRAEMERHGFTVKKDPVTPGARELERASLRFAEALAKRQPGIG